MDSEFFEEFFTPRYFVLFGGLGCIVGLAVVFYLVCEVYCHYCIDDDEDDDDEEAAMEPAVRKDVSKAFCQTVQLAIRLNRKVRKMRERKQEKLKND